MNISAHPSGNGLRNTHSRRLEQSGAHLARTRYSDLARKHTSRVLEHLFSGFTGLHFHLLWLPLPIKPIPESPPPNSACCKLVGSPACTRCRDCRARLFETAFKRHNGHQFTCSLGVRNFWIPIRIREETLGFAYLQAMRQSPKGARRQGFSKMPVANQAEFTQAAGLLRHIARHIELASMNDLETDDLRQAGRAVRALEQEQQRLCRALDRLQSGFPSGSTETNPVSHDEQIVRTMLERIERDYTRPITLLQLARDLGMNASYLSALFSSRVGAPFKTYLTEYRLQAAKEMLGAIDKRPSDIAFAVGYASEERFRAAFKKATGLPPTVWRGTILSRAASRM